MATKLGKIIADFQTALLTKVSVGGTNVNIQSITDDDGVALPEGQYYFTIDGDNSQKEHIICTLSTPTSLLTDIYSVSRQGEETAGVVREHRVGATVTITDHAHLKAINDLVGAEVGFSSTSPITYDGTITPVDPEDIPDKNYVDNIYASCDNLENDQTIDGIKTFLQLPTIPTPPVANTDAASKGYVDGVAIAGAPDATSAVKGVGMYATATEIIAGDEVSSVDGSPLMVNPKYLKDAGITPSAPISTLFIKPVQNLIHLSSSYITTHRYNSNTTQSLTQFYVPFSITANKVSFYVNTVGTAGVLRLGVYSEDGQTLEMDQVTGTFTDVGATTIDLGVPVAFTPGTHYFAVLPVGTADITLNTWATPDDTYSMYAGIAGEPRLAGTDTAAVAGTFDANFDPTALTFTQGILPFGRFN